MGKILLGITIGVALASAAFLALDRSSRHDVDSVERVSPTRSESETAIADESPTQATSVEDQPSTIEEPEEGPAESNQAREVARAEIEPPPTYPYPMTLPPEFDYVTEEARAGHWYEHLSRQPIDPYWSAQAEANLNSYLAANPEILAQYGFPTIHCRTTACVALFVSHDPALAEIPSRMCGTEVQLRQDWLTTSPCANVGLVFGRDTEGFLQGQWGEQFVDRVVVPYGRVSEDGVTTIAWQLERDTQQSSP